MIKIILVKRSSRQAFQYLQIQILHNFLLGFARFYVVVQAGAALISSIQYFFGFAVMSLTTIKSTPHMRSPMSRVSVTASFFKRGVDGARDVHRITTGREVRIVQEEHSFTKFRH